MAPLRRELNRAARNHTRLSVVLQIRFIIGGGILLLFWFSSSLLDNTTPLLDVPDHAQDLGVLIPQLEGQPINTVVPLTTKSDLPTQTYPLKSEVQVAGSNSGATKRQRLRFDWTNLPVQSKLAKLMMAHQTNCSLPLGNHFWRKKIFGLGSDLHVWGAALCNSIEEGNRIRTHNINPWVWIDQEKCDVEKAEASTLSCYFPHAEMQCPGDWEKMAYVEFNVSNPIHIKCNRTATSPMNIYKKTDWRAAGIEMLFSRVSPIVQEEGERQLNLVFPKGVPSDLITVHIRWGDKKFENKVMGISQTMDAIKKVRKQRGDNLEDPVSILLCTEDPKAVDAFKSTVPANWNVYIDQFYHEMIPFRPEDESIYNKVPKMSRALNGKTGLWSLGSLLVAMEANAFVLVLSSNWSRVMDELRRNVLNPRCRNCTFVVDVSEGKWKEW